VEHLLDEADAFEELTPVERRNQAEATNQVGDAGLFGRLVLAFRSNRVLGRLASRGQRRLELAVQPRRRGAEGARALKQARGKRVMTCAGQSWVRCGAASMAAASRSAASRWMRVAASTSPLARRWSTSASFSALGQAQSSPMVSGVTDWKALMNR
jgi:hypothetical protein